MLGMGITLSFKDFKEIFKRPGAIGVGVGAQFIIMPLLGWSLATLFKPTNVGVSTGLVALQNDTLGTLSLSLNGMESRNQLKLADSNGTVRDLTCTTAGVLQFNGANVGGASGITSVTGGTGITATTNNNAVTTKRCWRSCKSNIYIIRVNTNIVCFCPCHT